MGVLALLWGSSFLWMKLALGSLAPLQISLVRTFFGAVVLFVVLATAKMTLPRNRKIWGHMLFVATFGSAVPFTLFAFGGQTVDSGVSGVLNSTTPLFALTIGLVLCTEKFSNVVRMLGLGLGFEFRLEVEFRFEVGLEVLEVRRFAQPLRFDVACMPGDPLLRRAPRGARFSFCTQPGVSTTLRQSSLLSSNMR